MASIVGHLGVLLGGLVVAGAVVALVGPHGDPVPGAGQTIGWGFQLIMLSLIYDQIVRLGRRLDQMAKSDPVQPKRPLPPPRR